MTNGVTQHVCYECGARFVDPVVDDLYEETEICPKCGSKNFEPEHVAPRGE